MSPPLVTQQLTKEFLIDELDLDQFGLKQSHFTKGGMLKDPKKVPAKAQSLVRDITLGSAAFVDFYNSNAGPKKGAGDESPIAMLYVPRTPQDDDKYVASKRGKSVKIDAGATKEEIFVQLQEKVIGRVFRSAVQGLRSSPFYKGAVLAMKINVAIKLYTIYNEYLRQKLLEHGVTDADFPGELIVESSDHFKKDLDLPNNDSYGRHWSLPVTNTSNDNGESDDENSEDMDLNELLGIPVSLKRNSPSDDESVLGGNAKKARLHSPKIKTEAQDDDEVTSGDIQEVVKDTHNDENSPQDRHTTGVLETSNTPSDSMTAHDANKTESSGYIHETAKDMHTGDNSPQDHHAAGVLETSNMPSDSMTVLDADKTEPFGNVQETVKDIHDSGNSPQKHTVNKIPETSNTPTDGILASGLVPDTNNSALKDMRFADSTISGHGGDEAKFKGVEMIRGGEEEHFETAGLLATAEVSSLEISASGSAITGTDGEMLKLDGEMSLGSGSAAGDHLDPAVNDSPAAEEGHFAAQTSRNDASTAEDANNVQDGENHL